jgi:phage N-6-adenine-methyltransferase
VDRGLELVRPGSADLAHYDPEQGLKAVAVAETAERYWRRAKDARRLLEAVELKLTEQRQFVLWWDGQEKQHGGVSDRKRHLPQLGTDGLPDRLVIHRWRSRLKDEARFLATLEAAQARCLQAVESYRGGLPENARSLGTGETEWYTPAAYVEAARDVLGAIDLDPASSEIAQRTVRAARYFTRSDDGLRHEWPGRVWLNPPYTQPLIMHFVEKLVAEYQARRTQEAILLTHNYSDTAWFHLAASAASGICFTRGRIPFERADGFTAAPTQGQAFFYLGPRLGAFAARFSGIGLIVAPVHLRRGLAVEPTR